MDDRALSRLCIGDLNDSEAPTRRNSHQDHDEHDEHDALAEAAEAEAEAVAHENDDDDHGDDHDHGDGAEDDAQPLLRNITTTMMMQHQHQQQHDHHVSSNSVMMMSSSSTAATATAASDHDHGHGHDDDEQRMSNGLYLSDIADVHLGSRCPLFAYHHDHDDADDDTAAADSDSHAHANAHAHDLSSCMAVVGCERTLYFQVLQREFPSALAMTMTACSESLTKSANKPMARDLERPWCSIKDNLPIMIIEPHHELRALLTTLSVHDEQLHRH